jgi:4-hydroxythreonine-4-phosphate dehydrogenase
MPETGAAFVPPHGSDTILVTQGDPAGIGPELVLRAWLERKQRALPAFGWIGHASALETLCERLNWQVPLRHVEPDEVAGVFDTALPVIALENCADIPVTPGKPDAAAAPSTIASIAQAVALTMAGKAGAVVTMPIAKHVLYGAGFSYPGHTEFLASLSALPGQKSPRPVMLIWSELLAVVPVTIHIPLEAVPKALTTELIIQTARIVHRDYGLRFGIAKPRIALAGLNPHAGENGTIGHEDETVVAPAIRQLRAEGIDASGPYSADTLFHERARHVS